MKIFATEIEETADAAARGACPRQMLAKQQYDSTFRFTTMRWREAGFKGGAIEGPTPLQSVCAALCCRVGRALVRARVFVRALSQRLLRRRQGQSIPDKNRSPAQLKRHLDASAKMTEVLRGTASAARIIRFRIGAATNGIAAARTTGDSPRCQSRTRGNAFRCAWKCISTWVRSIRSRWRTNSKVITSRPSGTRRGGESVAMAEAIIPIEMISVLSGRRRWIRCQIRVRWWGCLPIRNCLLHGPLYVGDPYEIDREFAFLSGSRRTKACGYVRASTNRATRRCWRICC